MHTDTPHRKQSRAYALLALSFVAGAALASLCGCKWASNGQNASGVASYQHGQYGLAMQQFQQAVISDPTNPDSYYNLARTTHELGAQRSDATLLEKAEALYNQCLDLEPNHVECHRGLAVLLVETDRPDKAFALLKNWSSNNPDASNPRIEVARLYQEFGETATAKKYLEDAVSRDPDNARAWLALARIRESAGQYGQALANYQRSYSLNSDQPFVLQRIAALNRQIASQIDAAATGKTRIVENIEGGNQGRY